jgi:hypothetical protein
MGSCRGHPTSQAAPRRCTITHHAVPAIGARCVQPHPLCATRRCGGDGELSKPPGLPGSPAPSPSPRPTTRGRCGQPPPPRLVPPDPAAKVAAGRRPQLDPLEHRPSAVWPVQHARGREDSPPPSSLAICWDTLAILWDTLAICWDILAILWDTLAICLEAA